MRAEKRNFRGSMKVSSELDLDAESVDSYTELEETVKGENRVRNVRSGVKEVNGENIRRRVRSRRGVLCEEKKKEKGKEKRKEKEGEKDKDKEEKEKKGEKEDEREEGGNINDPFGSVIFFTVNVAPKTTNGKVTLNLKILW